MFGRGILFIAVVLVAIFGPYYLSERSDSPAGAAGAGRQSADGRSAVARWWGSMWTDSIDGRTPMASASPLPRPGQLTGNPPTYPNFSTPYGPQTQGYGNFVNGYPVAQAPLATQAAQTQDLRQLLRFDTTPAWVMSNWSRVSTEIWDADLAGMRVPLISGTSAHDLAGSLTYYFDQRQVLQRIAFQGTTGDPTYINALATQLGLQTKATYGGTTLVREAGEAVTDMLRVRPLSGQASPYRRFDVMFEFNRPGSERTVSKACDSLLKSCTSLPSLEMPKLPTSIGP